MQGNWVTAGILQDCENFASCEFSQVANFRSVANLPSLATVHLMPLFTVPAARLNFCLFVPL